MPGLIESKNYSESKRLFCAAKAGAAEAIDAIEWLLIHAPSLDGFQVVLANKPTVWSTNVEASATTPAVVVVFTLEDFDGTEKILLLDVWEPEEDDEDD